MALGTAGLLFGGTVETGGVELGFGMLEPPGNPGFGTDDPGLVVAGPLFGTTLGMLLPGIGFAFGMVVSFDRGGTGRKSSNGGSRRGLTGGFAAGGLLSGGCERVGSGVGPSLRGGA